MQFIITYRTDNWVGYGVMTIRGGSLDEALCEYEGSQDDIISIVRIF